MRSYLWRLFPVGVLWWCSVHAEAQNLSSYGGPALYVHYCASCHGAGGQGDGPVAPALKVKVPDLTRIAHRHGDTFPIGDLRVTIDGREVLPAHGTRTMPVWGQQFDERAISRLLAYLQSIQAR
jgi:mono/diheme cytochrome c family protein